MRVRLWNAMPIKSFEYFIRSTFPDSLFNRFSLIKCHYDSESSLKWSLTRSRAEKKVARELSSSRFSKLH